MGWLAVPTHHFTACEQQLACSHVVPVEEHVQPGALGEATGTAHCSHTPGGWGSASRTLVLAAMIWAATPATGCSRARDSTKAPPEEAPSAYCGLPRNCGHLGESSPCSTFCTCEEAGGLLLLLLLLLLLPLWQ
jgi:hypothetical protein